PHDYTRHLHTFPTRRSSDLGASDRFLNALSSRYEKGITWALDHTLLVLLATVMMLGLGLLIYSQLGSGFLPTMDEGSFVLDYWIDRKSTRLNSSHVSISYAV